MLEIALPLKHWAESGISRGWVLKKEGARGSIMGIGDATVVEGLPFWAPQNFGG